MCYTADAGQITNASGALAIHFTSITMGRSNSTTDASNTVLSEVTISSL